MWCSVVHERVTTMPRWPNLKPLPALLRCNLRVLELGYVLLSDELVTALPTTLRRLVWPRHAQTAALSRLVQLEDLSMAALADNDVRALCSLHTLTRLQVSVCECSAESASLVAVSLTRLCTLSVLESSDTPFEETMLLHGPTCLVRVALDSISDNIVRALQHTPLHLQALEVPHLIPLPLNRWPALRELDAGLCEDADGTLELLRGLAACTSLHKLFISLDIDESVAPALGDLITLQELELEVQDDDRNIDDAIVAQLPRLTQLTKLTLSCFCFDRKHIQALASLPVLRMLKLINCTCGELAVLTQLRCLELVECDDWDVSNLPVALESFMCEATCQDLGPLGRLTALRRLVLMQCNVGDALLSWGSLLRLEEVILRNVQTLPRTLLFELEATLPSLERVELKRCPEVDPLPLTSRVVVEED